MQLTSYLDPEALRLLAARWYGALADGPVALVAAALIAGLAVVVWTRARDRIRSRTNVLTRRAFSSPEGELWRRIQRAMPEHVIQMGVPLTRFLMVRRDGGLGRNVRRLAPLSVDYAVFRSDGTISSVVLMAESDGELPRAQRKLRRKLLERAQIRTVQWSLATMPTVDAIAGALDPDPAALVASERAAAARRRVGMPMAA